MPNISAYKLDDLLHLQVKIFDELRARKITRTDNIATGDLSEYLFCKAFDWAQEANSKKSFDAIDQEKNRIQIKGRRLTLFSKSIQLSAIRDLKGFDYLAVALFDHNYNISRAAIIPSEIVSKNSSYQTHTNSHIFNLRDKIWALTGVKDVTNEIANVLKSHE